MTGEGPAGGEPLGYASLIGALFLGSLLLAACLAAGPAWALPAALALAGPPALLIFLSEGRSQSMSDTVILYRPVGQAELDLIRAAEMRGFPPRLDWQPIFYPVLNEDYATQIARDWNTKDAASGFVGYVTRFAVRADFLARYEVQTVGNRTHQEYWIPAEELAAFNRALVGPIEVIATFRPAAATP